MEYLAHIDGDREQSVKDHLQGTADLAGEFAAKFGKADWGYCCGMLHDIGKYSLEFQRKIHENLNIQVDHSTAGAKVCNELGGYYWLLPLTVVSSRFTSHFDIRSFNFSKRTSIHSPESL